LIGGNSGLGFRQRLVSRYDAPHMSYAIDERNPNGSTLP
jgi:hypothetical protein